jgi:hypothetical protein
MVERCCYGCEEQWMEGPFIWAHYMAPWNCGFSNSSLAGFGRWGETFCRYKIVRRSDGNGKFLYVPMPTNTTNRAAI